MSSPRFLVNTNSLFLCGTGDGAVAVMDTVTDLNAPQYPPDNWKIVAAAIGTMTVNTTVPRATFPVGSIVYRGLEIFGTVIEGGDLDKLRDELLNTQLLVNRDGYQVKYLDQNAAAGFVIGNNHMVKLNNLFGWGRYGVKPAMTTVWNRYDVAGGEAVVDYVAAEEKRREMEAELDKQRREIAEWKLKSVAKEEILGHYKRLLEETKELMMEKESGKERLREVIEEKNRVVEEQSRTIKDKEVEIHSLELMTVEKKKEKIEEDGKTEDGIGEGDQLKEKVMGDDDDFKAAMDSFLRGCRKDLKAAIVATNRVFFVNVVLLLLVVCVCLLRFFG